MVKHLTKETFQAAIDEDKLTMVDFWAEWCGPCRMLGPVLDDIAKTMSDKVSVCKVNTDLEQELAMRYNISSIPCVIYFRKGEALRASLGFKPKENFVKEIDELLGK
ncbi:thioredoxin [Entomospira culicis]|uniref:Thioredoxin n=1 Tax=Entomospira culicis TaxID=2719989 RepID=A0A968GHQ9_9SPIO|nr:thioredoxin [Entomospira culicis]NIZ18979.1 thioredoxin [Entomospira culicis]NIZ69194.1 thioredoxin [Entomospira culicis]WDI37780.1 thioredoxin [Entomospira culicis]WDI39408.1 thioredoxin [Entomospira culicis]